MNSIGEACTDLKKQYDDCFNSWFSDHFLKGRTNDSMCAPMFKVYQDCVKKAIKAHNLDLDDVRKDLLGTPQEKEPPHKS